MTPGPTRDRTPTSTHRTPALSSFGFLPGETYGFTTPEGGTYSALNGVVFTHCACVPGDQTSVYGIVAGVTTGSFVMHRRKL